MADDLTDLGLYEYEGDEPTRTSPIPPPTVDITLRTVRGDVISVKCHGDEVRLTVAGADGMVTVVLSEYEAKDVGDLLDNGSASARRNRTGF